MKEICPCMAGPWRITFETNPDLCNLHCSMCEIHSPYNHEKFNRGMLPFSVIDRIVTSAAPYGLKEIIPSTMGEPLLYQDFDLILMLVKKNALKINLTTNGTFPGRGVRSWAESILPVASDTKISINGATARTAEDIMRGLNFERQISNLTEYIRVRDEVRSSGINDPTVTVQATFMRSNLNELPALLNMAIDMGADRFKGHHVWVTYPEIECESLKVSDISKKEWNKCVENMRKIADKKRLPSGKKIALANIYPLSENESCNSIRTMPFLMFAYLPRIFIKS